MKLTDCPTTISKPANPAHWGVCYWCERVLPREVFRKGPRSSSRYCPNCNTPEVIRQRNLASHRVSDARKAMSEDERADAYLADEDARDRRIALCWADATVRYARLLPPAPLERVAVSLRFDMRRRFRRYDSGRAEPSHYDPTVSLSIAGVHIL